jgi:hypothetical protein
VSCVFGIPISEIITVYGPQALAATAIVIQNQQRTLVMMVK